MGRQDIINFVTTGNVKPDVNNLPFAIRTEHVKFFIQEVFDSICERIQKTGGNAEHVRAYLATVPCGKFNPFILVMGTNVLTKKNRKDEKGLNQFNVQDDAPAVMIQKQYYEFIKALTYSKRDGDMFMSDTFRKSFDITRKQAGYLRSIRSPKIVRYGGKEMVTLLIDPLKVFWLMLRDPKHPKDTRFVVDIQSVTPISDGDSVYKVIRRVKDENSSNGPIDKIIQKSILSQL